MHTTSSQPGRLASQRGKRLSQDRPLEHERQGVLKVTLERRQPPRADRAVHRPVVRAQRHLHDVRRLEPALLLRRGHERRLRRPDGEDARLRRVDDRGEVRDVEHAEVRDGESSTLAICQ